MTNPERDETLRRWLASCDDEPLDARDRRYVALEGLRGEDRKLALLDTIVLAPDDAATCQLFTGFRGTGKSTELARLQGQLEDIGFIVLVADAKDYHTLTRDLHVAELLPILAGAFGEAAGAELPRDFIRASWWDRMSAFLKKELVLEPALNLAGVQLKPALLGDDAFLVSLRRSLAGRVDALAARVHEFIGETVVTLLEARPDKRGVVFMFDNLEKLTGPEHQFLERMQSVLEVFSEHHRYLHLPRCHAIFSIPLYIQILFPGITQLYDGDLEILPTIKVFERDPARTPYEPGVAALRRLVAKRLPLADAFAPGVLDRLIAASAGHLRGLFELIGEVLRRARRAGLPVDDATTDVTIARFNEKRRHAVRADAVPLLETVRRDTTLEALARDDLARIAPYLDNHLVLCYRNGEGWYDLHPAIREHVTRVALKLADRGADGD